VVSPCVGRYQPNSSGRIDHLLKVRGLGLRNRFGGSLQA
jgi:hypothetical protein